MWRPAGATYDEGRVEETGDAETADGMALRQPGTPITALMIGGAANPSIPPEVYNRALDGDEISRLATG